MRLIDADALKAYWECFDDPDLDYQYVFKSDIDAAPTIDAVEVVRCGKCRHYQGNHDVPGCAPCDFWGIGAVMWDDFCKRGEMWDE